MVYEINAVVTEPSAEEVYVGNYGSEWLEFMHSNHPNLVEQMTANNTLMLVAQSVDDRAWEYRFLLEVQYKKAHPYPNTYEANVKWHTTRNFYVDSEVMRDKVLLPVTQP
jgi:hypothetical protein